MAPLLIAVIVLIVAWIASGVRVVRPYERAAIERFGRYRKTVGPGVRLTLPLVQRLRRVDSRTRLADISATCVTDDDVALELDVTVEYRCVDPRRFLYDVADPDLGLVRAAETQLRNLVAMLAMKSVLDGPETLCSELERGLAQVVEPWGLEVATVELPRIDLPPEVLDAMHAKATSDCNFAALATNAEIELQTAVAHAEAERRARQIQAQTDKDLLVLEAQGRAEAVRLLADAARYRQQSLAHGRAEALKIVRSALVNGSTNPDLDAVKYVEALIPIADAGTDAGPLDMDEIAGLVPPAANGTAEEEHA